MSWMGTSPSRPTLGYTAGLASVDNLILVLLVKSLFLLVVPLFMPKVIFFMQYTITHTYIFVCTVLLDYQNPLGPRLVQIIKKFR